jgi:hypothetical protein
MNECQTDARTIIDASPRMARWTWIINGSLFAIGASISILVYFSGSGRILQRVEASKESLESQLFSFPFFQLVLFLMPLLMDPNWRRFQSATHNAEQRERARDAKFRQLDGVFLYYGVCSMMIFMGSIVFVMGLASALLRSAN